MTPGYAKTRQELPWLYYPEADRVIINAHNFGGGGIWTPAVNGKMPVAAWVPSRDTAGNGTTTLTDLVGSNDGTLTNMDAATDWVLDDGKYALDFDGENDYVEIPHGPEFAAFSSISISCWLYHTGDDGYIISKNTDGLQGPAIFIETGNRIAPRSSGFSNSDNNVLTLNSWNHILCVWNGSTVEAWINGALVTWVSSNSQAVINTTDPWRIGTRPSGSTARHFLNAKIDDLRIWNVALDATDTAALYAAGRGGQA